VALDQQTGFYAFEYEPKFVKLGIDLAPLKMPLSEATEPFIFPRLSVETYQRLPAFLADALPDKFGSALIEAWMADQGVGLNSITSLDKLAYMGERSMGAMIFKPNRGPGKTKPTAVIMEDLVKQARSAIAGDFKNADHAGEVLRQIIQVGTSAGGARAKATIALNSQSQEIKTGQFVIPDGFDAWLLKFDGVPKGALDLGTGAHFGCVEYIYSEMAKLAGITMSECRLLRESDRAHFMTRRFDRIGNERVHMQTLCAMSHLDFNEIGAHSYSQLFQTVHELGLGREALEQTLRRMVFNVLAANCDDHTKNFSFLLHEGRGWELAPAYDITFAYDPDNKWLRQHLMSINGKFSEITESDVRELADRYELRGVCKDIIAQAIEALSAWPVLATRRCSAGKHRSHHAYVSRCTQEVFGIVVCAPDCRCEVAGQVLRPNLRCRFSTLDLQIIVGDGV
jgi:serine/threonine-protein kinase HipA